MGKETAYIVMAYIVMAYTVMACIVMACIVMAYIVMAYVVMAYIVMAYIVMAQRRPETWVRGDSRTEHDALERHARHLHTVDHCLRHRSRLSSCGPHLLVPRGHNYIGHNYIGP